MPATAKPAPFDVDAYLSEQDLWPLEITVKGAKYLLPHFESLSLDQAEAISDGSIKATLADICGQETADVLASMPAKGLNKILELWQAQAEDEPGEDKASSGS